MNAIIGFKKMNVPSVVGWWVARGGAAEAGARGPLQGAGNSSFPAWASLPYLLAAGYQLPVPPSLCRLRLHATQS